MRCVLVLLILLAALPAFGAEVLVPVPGQTRLLTTELLATELMKLPDEPFVWVKPVTPPERAIDKAFLSGLVVRAFIPDDENGMAVDPKRIDEPLMAVSVVDNVGIFYYKKFLVVVRPHVEGSIRRMSYCEYVNKSIE